MKQPRPRIATIVATLLTAILLTMSYGTSVLFATPLEQSAGTVNRTSNVRSGPSVDFDILDVFAEGQDVEIVGQNADGSWYALSGGQWIAAFLVDGAVDTTALPVMTADDTAMSDDSDAGSSDESASSETDEEATEESSESEASEPAASADTGSSYEATVKSNGNLRAGPSTLYDVVGGVAEGATINLIGQTPYGNWFILDTGEWISISLIANPPGPLTYVTPDPSVSESSEDSEVAAEATPEAEEVTEGDADDEAMDDEADTDEEAMDDETMDDETMDEEAMDDETMDDEAMDDEAMDDEAMDDEADTDEEAMDDETMDDEAMDDEAMDDEADTDEEAMDDEAMDEEADADEEATPEPTATPEPAAEPEVTIPDGWAEITDSERGYSLAIPPGWSELDLRGSQFAQLATTFGQGAAVADLQDFLSTEEGQSIGVVAITDIANTFFGGLPTLLNVSIIEAPGVTSELLVDYIREVLELNEAMLGDVNIEDISATTINNLPAVTGVGTGDLTNVGVNAEAFVKVVGLIYNDKIYMITLGTQSASMDQYAPVFDDIIGTLKPE